MKVLFDVPAGTISIEGSEPELVELLNVVRDVAPKFSQIQILTGSSTTGRLESPVVTGTQQPLAGEILDNGNGQNRPAQTMRQFVRSLSLKSQYEKITAIAYYVKHQAIQDTFTPKEMGSWFTQCGYQRPTQMPVTVFDARRKHGYVESPGRGKWKISTNGENLIVGKLEDQTGQ